MEYILFSSRWGCLIVLLVFCDNLPVCCQHDVQMFKSCLLTPSGMRCNCCSEKKREMIVITSFWKGWINQQLQKHLGLKKKKIDSPHSLQQHSWAALCFCVGVIRKEMWFLLCELVEEGCFPWMKTFFFGDISVQFPLLSLFYTCTLFARWFNAMVQFTHKTSDNPWFQHSGKKNLNNLQDFTWYGLF